MGIFMSMLQPFDHEHINLSPELPGVYIIYDRDIPVYVGRSAVSIRERLHAHKEGRGNWFLRLIGPSPTVSFEYETMLSGEQAESKLIRLLRTKRYANYRLETDPAMRHLKDL